MRRVIPAWLLGSLALGTVACSAGRPSGEGRLVVQGGVVVVRAVDGVARSVHGAVTLHRGDTVDVGVGATATVELRAGGSLGLRTGSVVRFAGGPTLERGDLLVATSRSQTVNTITGPVRVAGASRLRRDLALTVGTYKGKATVVSAGRIAVVPALRQLSVTGLGLLPDRPAPIVLSSADAWDRQYLGLAIDLTARLDGASRGFSAEMAAGPSVNASFLRTSVVALGSQPSFSDQLLSLSLPTSGVRPPGELLVGASIAVAGPGPFEKRWAGIFSFRDEGASWGLVAVDQAADSNDVLNLIAGAINRSVLVFTAPASAGSTPPEALVGAPAVEGSPAVVASPAPSPPPTSVAAPARGRPGPGNATRPPVTSLVTTPSSPPGVPVPVTVPPVTSPPVTPPPVTLPPVTLPPVTLPGGSPPVVPTQRLTTHPPTLPSPPSPVSPVVDPFVVLVNRLLGG
jgi:hypothetical protein